MASALVYTSDIDGDFAEAFNGNASGYTDYNVSFQGRLYVLWTPT